MTATSQSIAFQAFVWHEGSHWVARPLLSPDLWGHGENPATAVDDLERALYRRFEELASGDEEDLLWLAYQPPDLATTRLLLQVGYGKRTLECTLVVASFVSGAQRYVAIPRLEHWFAFDAEIRDWHATLQEQLDAYLRYRRAQDDEWLPPSESELRRDRVLPARIFLRSELAELRLGQTLGDDVLRALLNDDMSRRSAPRELSKLADDLTDRRDLHRALVPHPATEIVLETMLLETTRQQGTRPAPPLALIGPPGSGRTTLVHEAIHQMNERTAAAERQALLDAINRRRKPKGAPAPPRVYHFDPQRIVTGMSVVGQWQRRLELVLEWVRDRRRKTEHQPGSDIIFVDDPVVLARVGRSRGSDMVASWIFRSWLQEGAFPMIVEATPEQWHRLTELDRPFAELFRVVRVDPPDTATVLTMAVRHRARLEDACGIELLPSAIERALELHHRYGGSRGLPGGLIDRLEQVALATPAGGKASASEVDAAFRASTGLREHIASPEAPLDDAELRKRIASKLVGQPSAVDALASAVHALKSGLRPQGRPVCCWLFVGPTGVGKTEAAKVLVQTLYDSPDHLVRFDMNAFADPYAVSRLIGDLESGEGLLTSAIRRKPFAVLLLDEIEKAHPAVHDLLLQLLDEGRLTDALGRTTSFESCAVILTSNVGATEVAQSVGFDRSSEALEQSYKSAVSRAFRPEFVNRLDRIVAFSSLGKAELRVVADLQLQRLLCRDGFRNRTVLLDLSDDTLDALAADAWDPRFGARGLKRALERRLVGAAAAELAALPLEQPVRLRASARAGAEGVELRVEPLRWAEQLEAPPPPQGDPQERIAQIEAMLEPLRPVGFIGLGAQAGEHAEVLALLEALRELRDALDDEDLGSELPVGTSAAIHRMTGFAKIYPRVPWKHTGRPVLSPERLRAGLRALLLELAQRQPERPIERTEQEIALARLRAESLVRRRPPGAIVQIRPATRETPAFLDASAWVYRGLSRLVTALGGQPPHKENGFIHRNIDHYWAVQGAGMFDLLSLEAGLHWWLPAAEAPTAVEVQVDPLTEAGETGLLRPGESPPEALRPPRIRYDTILRVICPPATRYDQGAVHDLRTGEVVRCAEEEDNLVRWVLAARGAP